MPLETGKQRKSRIELDYYRRADGLARLRNRLALAVVAAGVVWFLISPTWDRGANRLPRLFQWDRMASPGALAIPHTMWESRCETCHVPFALISAPMRPVAPGEPADGMSSNCVLCHRGPAHQATQLSTEVASCASCHRDHRGRDTSLISRDDGDCTRCHADLRRHRATSGPNVANSVAAFDSSRHPQFAAVLDGQDRSQLHFNHALHLAPGLTLENEGIPRTYSQLERSGVSLPEPWKDRPGFQSVQLACNDCHWLDADENAKRMRAPTELKIPPRGDGAYMLPVTFENHCQVCHPLHFDAKLPRTQVAHGVSPAEVVAELKRHYAAAAVAEDPVLLRRPLPPGARSIPGRGTIEPSPSIEQAIEAKVQAAVRKLFQGLTGLAANQNQSRSPIGGGCVECHEMAALDGRITPDVVVAQTVRVELKNLWFEHARFDHRAHRALDCLECHPKAATSTHGGDVLIPGIETCVACHAPMSRDSSGPGGASFACVECHRYHNGAHPRQSLAASARDASVPWSIPQFQQGRKSGQKSRD